MNLQKLDKSESPTSSQDAKNPDVSSMGMLPVECETPYLGQGEDHCHAIEREIRKQLLALDSVSFSSLEVRQLDEAICLSGRIESVDVPDMNVIERIALKCGATKVCNRLESSQVITPESTLRSNSDEIASD